MLKEKAVKVSGKLVEKFVQKEQEVTTLHRYTSSAEATGSTDER